MGLILLSVLSILSVSIQANVLSEDSANVCLSVPAYAEVRLPDEINFQPLAKSEKGATKRFRANDQIELEANVPVQLIASSISLSDGTEVYTPDVFIDKKSGVIELPYSSGLQSLELRMDMNLPTDEIQKAGEYTGSLNVIVMADLAVDSCL